MTIVMQDTPDELDEFLEAQSGNMPPPNPNASPNSLSSAEIAQPSNDWSKALMDASCWARTGHAYFPVASVVDELEPGAYRCQASNTGPYLEKMNILTDNLLALPDNATEKLLAEFSQFWKLRPAFDKRGFTFKRGMLMWGPPGSGKTSAVWQMTKHLVDNQKGVVVFVEHPGLALACLTMLRRIEPTRPVITVMEDIDAIVRQHGDHQILALLDGEFQIDNVVHLATTNYPHMLDKRFIDRPSRFDTIMKVGMPSPEARRVYLSTKEPELSDTVLTRWVNNSEGYSIAHLREVCIAINCFGQKEEQVFNRINKMREKFEMNEDGDDTRNPTGFTHGLAAINSGAGRLRNG